jgi:hypothetical protein
MRLLMIKSSSSGPVGWGWVDAPPPGVQPDQWVGQDLMRECYARAWWCRVTAYVIRRGEVLPDDSRPKPATALWAPAGPYLSFGETRPEGVPDGPRLLVVGRAMHRSAYAACLERRDDVLVDRGHAAMRWVTDRPSLRLWVGGDAVTVVTHEGVTQRPPRTDHERRCVERWRGNRSEYWRARQEDRSIPR